MDKDNSNSATVNPVIIIIVQKLCRNLTSLYITILNKFTEQHSGTVGNVDA